VLASSPHPFGDQRPFILCDSSANVQQQLVVGISAHRPIDETDLAPAPLEFLKEQHLMNVLASQAVGSSEQDLIKGTEARLIS
jgi:hypothetical protein